MIEEPEEEGIIMQDEPYTDSEETIMVEEEQDGEFSLFGGGGRGRGRGKMEEVEVTMEEAEEIGK